MKEKWERWVPVAHLSPYYEIIYIDDSLSSFEIILQEERSADHKVKIFFPYGVEAYHEADEGLRLQTFSSLINEYGPDFFAPWTFFTIQNSSYAGFMENVNTATEPLFHYVIATSDPILEILSTYEPCVEIFRVG